MDLRTNTADIYSPPGTNATGRRVLLALQSSARAGGVIANTVYDYKLGRAYWLILWGVGAPGRSAMRDQHIAAGGRVALWDIGFFKRTKRDGHCKVSIDQDYISGWLDQTEPDTQRWSDLGIALRDDYNPDGHVVLAGIGPKEHAYRGHRLNDWESSKLAELKERFPGRRILYRPKPKRRYVELKCEMDNESPINEVLHGAALVVCMHSNVAVDAVIAGVPFESEAGASIWLRGKEYTREVRLDFLQRLARWQYKTVEMAEAWMFIRSMDEGRRMHA